MKNPKLLLLFNIIGFIGTITVNALANALPINGRTTGELSALYPNLFVPAGFTFSIWGIIYLLLLAFVGYQIVLFFQGRLTGASFMKATGYWFFNTCLANMAWILAWHYQLVWLSLFIMLALLGSLVSWYSALGVGKEKVKGTRAFLVHMPVSTYLGWISVATIANTTALLVSLDWEGFGFPGQFWAAILVVIATIFGLAFLKQRRDLAYSLVVIWALYGIFSKRANDVLLQDQAVEITAISGIVLLTIGAIYFIFISKKQKLVHDSSTA